ncbi:MAG: ATP-binding protein [Coleofasciculaceae cyanobacterium]
MTIPLICHFLIGPPGCGKSTFANLLTQYSEAKIISTDKIRLSLFGDESIQGDWSLIEEKVITQIHNYIISEKPVIYDATNVKKEWRCSLLKQVNNQNVKWIAWYLQTPLEICKKWNKKRNRQVPEEVIEALFRSLQANIPERSEGFVAVNVVDVWSRKWEVKDIKDRLYIN